MLALFTAATTLARLALLILARGFLTESLAGRFFFIMVTYKAVLNVDYLEVPLNFTLHLFASLMGLASLCLWAMCADRSRELR